MGARSGNNYLSALRRLKAALWLDDARVDDPTIHPALKPLARSIASLYDLQMEHPGAMTYRLEDGDRVGYSWVSPTTVEDFHKRSIMLRRWAAESCGLIEETPDTMNLVLAAMAAAADFFAESDAHFGAHLTDYYREARHRDWCIASATSETDSELQMIDRTDAGIVVTGTRRLTALGPLAEELLMWQTAPKSPTEALVFAISSNARGIEMRCRTTLSPSGPLPTIACIATFDDVAIPSNRIFLCGDVARCNSMLERTGASAVLAQQQTLKALVAAEVAVKRG